MPSSELRGLAAAFSPSVFKALASARVGHAAERVSQLINSETHASKPLAEAFDTAHRRLLANYPTEYAFKNEVVSRVVLGRHSPTTATALVEQPMSSSIADLLILNGSSTIYEVKTDLDSFARLPSQLADYQRHAEFVYVVVSDRRAQIAERQVPQAVGVVALKKGRHLSVVRAARSNVDRLRHVDLFRLLRTAEAKALATREVGFDAGVAPGRVRDEAFAIFNSLSIEHAHSATVAALRARGASARTLISSPFFPQSLRALAYGTELSHVATERLRDRLREPIASILEQI